MLPIQVCQPWHVRAFVVRRFGPAGPGTGSLARGTHVRQLQLPPDSARYREHHGRLPPVTPGHLGRRRRLIPVSAPNLYLQLKTSNRFLEFMVVFKAMEGWSFLAEYQQLSEAETEAFGRLLGTPVQRLATIAHGDGIRTTHVTAPSLVHIRNATIGTAAGATTTEPGGSGA